MSQEGLWRGFDVKVVDGAVNGAGYLVSGVSIVLRLLQNGSVQDLRGVDVRGRGR